MATKNGRKAGTLAAHRDPLSLGAVEQTIFVLRCFEKGITIPELLNRLGGEYSLVQGYFLFCREFGWLEELHGRWTLSKEGRDALAHFEADPPRAGE